MADGSKIEWTDTTWNPIRGCSKKSPGCENCYAMHYALRFAGKGQPYEGLAKANPTNWTGVVRLAEHKLDEPLHWAAPRRVFVNSTSDLFHEKIPQRWQDRVVDVMEQANQHTYQVLTKRPEVMLDYLEERYGDDYAPPENVWWGVSIEDQQRADERLEIINKFAPGWNLFLSVEPLLEPIDLRFRKDHNVKWVIVGGESGKAKTVRPCDIEWIRSIVEQCKLNRIPVFVKQLGSFPTMSASDWHYLQRKPLLNHRFDRRCPKEKVPLFFNHPKGGAVAEWPSDLQVREWPTADAPVA